MTLTEASKWLQWAHAQYGQQNTEASKAAKIEIYLLSRLMNTHVDLYGSNPNIKSTLWTEVEKAIATAKNVFGVNDLPKITLHVLDGPSDTAEINLAQQKMREFTKMKGDEDWSDVCEELKVTLDARWKKQQLSHASSSSSSAPYLPFSNTNALTIEGLCTSLVEHVQGLKVKVGNNITPQMTHFLMLGALYHAILTHFLTSNPSLKSKPANTLCLYTGIENYIQALNSLGVTRVSVNQVVLPIDEGKQTPLDHELIQNLKGIWFSLNQFPHNNNHYEREVLKEIRGILETLEQRADPDRNKYFHPRAADSLMKKK